MALTLKTGSLAWMPSAIEACHSENGKLTLGGALPLC